MKIKVLLLFMICTFAAAFAQSDTVSIYDVQFQHPDSLAKYGDRKSIYEGKKVTVTGVVMNRTMLDSSLRMLSAGANAVYLQDPAYNEYAAILVRFPGTPTTAYNQLDTGFVIRVTGVVQDYNQTTQLNISDFQAEDVLGWQNRPEPIEMPLDSIVEKGTGAYKAIAEKWEGMRVKFRNLVITEANATGTGAYKVVDNNTTPLIVYNQSNYYRGKSSPNPGTAIDYLVGHVTTSTQYGNEINPIYPNDRLLGNVVPPTITKVLRDSATVGYGQEVVVSSEINDLDGSVLAGELYYSVNNGPLTKVNLAKDGTKWTAKIPAQNDSSYVEYFLRAWDDQYNYIIEPSDTSKSRFSYFVLNRPLTIREVQYSPRGSGYSPYNGYNVTLNGIVTSDTMYYYMQDNPGPWSGINLFLTDSVKVGDEIQVTGRVEESFNQTRLTAITNFTRLSSDNTVEPVVLSTADIAKSIRDVPEAEQWEGILVKYNNVTVTDVNADGEAGPDEGSGGNRNYGEIFIADDSGVDTRVELQDGFRHKYHNGWDTLLVKDANKVGLVKGDKFTSITGFLEYTFSNYKLAPRFNSDFTGYTPITPVSVNENEIRPTVFSLSQNYPNPFNPSTTINFSLAKAGVVKLTVYNIIGEKVQTLMNSYMNAGQHKAVFNASNLPSGIYFYELQTPEYNNVKKMMLVK